MKTTTGAKRWWGTGLTLEGGATHCVFVRLKGPGDLPDYLILPASFAISEMDTRGRRWVAQPGRGGHVRAATPARAMYFVKSTDECWEDWNPEPYLNMWTLLEQDGSSGG